MKAFTSACIIFAICISASLQGNSVETPFSSCSYGTTIVPWPTSVRMAGCKRSPCKFQNGTYLFGEWDFVTHDNVKFLKPHVSIIAPINPVTYPWAHDPNACNSLSKGSCPLKKGVKATYYMKMFLISSTSRFTPFFYEFNLLDENNKVQVCFRLYCKFI